MNNNKGFISMSLVYSFFIVFVAISVSLLAIYSSKLLLVRNLNKDIKEQLIKKGNEELVVFNNLMVDGGFENANNNWAIVPSGNSSASITDKFKYNDNYSLLIKKKQNDGTLYNYSVQNKNKINMQKDHIYYLQRIYNLNRKMLNELIFERNCYSHISFTNGTSNFYQLDSGSISDKYDREPGGWCVNVDSSCSPKTIESSIFRFNQNTGNYTFTISGYITDNSDITVKNSFFEFYTDNYILIDLTAAFGEDKANTLLMQNQDGDAAKMLENIIAGDYFEGKKIYNIYKTELEELL